LSQYFHTIPAHPSTYTLSLHDALPISHRPPISQTAFFAHMPLNRRPVSKDMAQTAEKAGSGEGKSECLVLAQKAELFTEPKRRQDRKSTRLNSSHVSISYAVFCLKKKK